MGGRVGGVLFLTPESYRNHTAGRVAIEVLGRPGDVGAALDGPPEVGARGQGLHAVVVGYVGSGVLQDAQIVHHQWPGGTVDEHGRLGICRQPETPSHTVRDMTPSHTVRDMTPSHTVRDMTPSHTVRDMTPSHTVRDMTYGGD